MVIFVAFGCSRISDKAKMLSFQNMWGVAYYYSPKLDGSCSYRIGFLPLKNLADTSLIKETSSISEFRYDPGMNFLCDDRTLIDQIHSANPTQYLYEKGNDNHRINWAFVKLKYHLNPKYSNPELGNLLTDTLYSKQISMPIQYYELGVKIVTDTAYSKNKYINPWTDPHFRERMKKFNNYMPCMLRYGFHL